MTAHSAAEHFNDLIARVGWSARAIGKLFGVAHGTVSDWQSGRRSPDPVVIRYLERVARAIESVPVPDRVDRRYRD